MTTSTPTPNQSIRRSKRRAELEPETGAAAASVEPSIKKSTKRSKTVRSPPDADVPAAKTENQAAAHQQAEGEAEEGKKKRGNTALEKKPVGKKSRGSSPEADPSVESTEGPTVTMENKEVAHQQAKGEVEEGKKNWGNKALEKKPLGKKSRGSSAESDPSVESTEPTYLDVAESIDLGGEVGEEMEDDGRGGESTLLLKKFSEKGREKAQSANKHRKKKNDEVCMFVGEPVLDSEARQRWPERYKKKCGRRGSISLACLKDDEEDLIVKCHYLQAKVDSCIYNLYDDAYVEAGEGELNYIGRIVEFFKTNDEKLYFTAQWFFRANDTVIQQHSHSHDMRRVFLSEEKNDNLLDCIVSRIKIIRLSHNVDLEAEKGKIAPSDLYYNMSYNLDYTTFANLPPDNAGGGSETSSTVSSEELVNVSNGKSLSDSEVSCSGQKPEVNLLDLYSGCGAMSTGLCLGANLSGVNLVTRWAVDFNPHACKSLKLNHPETEVRNEKAEDFLSLLREWEKLCKSFSLLGTRVSGVHRKESDTDDEEVAEYSSEVTRGEFEVGKIVGICYGDPLEIKKVGLKFKVRWKGYGPSEDTWEPIDGLIKCQERIKDFVERGFRSNILPLPGDVDVICGGPPCQGISGFNRFRNYNAPLEDTKNRQMLIFMDIVEFLRPKYVLMENVVDILKFAGGFLGRYAISRLVGLNYQARLGMMAAGCYGLPQFRMRAFLWGARPTEKLPQFPLPTHNVVVRGGIPNEFEQSMVALNEHQPRELEQALCLGDAISDLPPITNDECREEMVYTCPPKTEFQHFIRASKFELEGSTNIGQTSSKARLFDHQPLQLNQDDFQRVCQIPKRKGANFRDLPGVLVGANNTVEWDPTIPRVYLSSGKPLVPDYAMSFIKGRSPKPFGRLWWDETVPTVVTRAEPHNQVILHPEQDRVLSIRENARLQGFPDYYKLCGPVKERYIQVGNAVAVPVARVLGYALGLAIRGVSDDQPILTLPRNFPRLDRVSSDIDVESDDVVVDA